MVGLGWFMQFNATFNNISVISWQSVLLVEETVVPLTCRKSLTNFIYNFRIKSAMYKRSIGRVPKLRSSNKTAQYKLSIKGQYLLPLPVDDNSCQHYRRHQQKNTKHNTSYFSSRQRLIYKIKYILTVKPVLTQKLMSMPLGV